MVEMVTWKKLVLVGAGIAAVSTLGGTLYAGEKETWTVRVFPDSRIAYGTLGSARNSSNSVESLECHIESWDDASTEVTCWAVNSSGTSGGCSSTNASLVNTARGISSDSYVYFKWDSAGECTKRA
jgi:hypothetical protein